MVEVTQARAVHVRGIVQGVGFRPFVFRLAREHALTGWVLNEDGGVQVFLEGPEPSLTGFLRALAADAPSAAVISGFDVEAVDPLGLAGFEIRRSERNARPVARISPDLPVCDSCLRELSDPANRRFGYPYINCTDCGPRYSILHALPYDRSQTTMKEWLMDSYCASEYDDPVNRRFHAQPVACPECGPHYYLETTGSRIEGDGESVRHAASMLAEGLIVAIKGVGGFHLACDASNAAAVERLRERKFRKEKPFAVMARDLEVTRTLVSLSRASEELLRSPARPIVLAPSRVSWRGVAPDTRELGVMLPYAPIHDLLFSAGAPDALVMTSGNRSSEPVAYRDEDARAQLTGIADVFLTGERPIARRVDDSVVRAGAFGPVVLRRARGLAPAVVSMIPARRPMLALGADLKNTIALAVDGEVLVSQHIGDLDHYPAVEAFQETIGDLLRMYDVPGRELLIAHDSHPEYVSTRHALEMPAALRCAVQHHHAHVASVLAEREAWDVAVLGVACDGTGYGDDGAVWGGEIFAGSVRGGFTRVAHLRPALLAGGDAAAQHPVQAAAGFLNQIDGLPDLCAPPFHFDERYPNALQLLHTNTRTFITTSMGRLFDAAAALTGFTRAMSFEAQAAMWLEQLARGSRSVGAYPFPLVGNELDFRPLIASVIHDRLRGRDPAEVAYAFHLAVVDGLTAAIGQLSATLGLNTVVLSGGVFQNQLLLEGLWDRLAELPLTVWINHAVPPNDGGISLGQLAIAAVRGGIHA